MSIEGGWGVGGGKVVLCTYSFIEHTRLSVLIGTFWTINKAITQNMIVNATVPALSVRCGTSESLHAIRSRWTFWNWKMWKNYNFSQTQRALINSATKKLRFRVVYFNNSMDKQLGGGGSGAGGG